MREKNLKLKLWQNLYTQIVTKLKNQIVTKSQKLKLRQNSKFKSWQNKKIKLWEEFNFYLFLTNSKFKLWKNSQKSNSDKIQFLTKQKKNTWHLNNKWVVLRVAFCDLAMCSKNQPLGRFFLVVAMSVICVFICPLPM